MRSHIVGPLTDAWAMSAQSADGRLLSEEVSDGRPYLSEGLWDGREVHHFTRDRELSEGPTAQAALKAGPQACRHSRACLAP